MVGTDSAVQSKVREGTEYTWKSRATPLLDQY